MSTMKKLTAAGCALWIIGLAASITGLNLAGDTGKWLSISGNIVFLIGLAITGAVWLRRKKNEKEPENEEKQRT